MKTTGENKDRLTLRVKWSLVIFLVGSFFLAGLALFSYFRFRNMMLEEMTRSLNVAAQSVAQNLQISFSGLQKELSLSVSQNQKLGEILEKVNASYDGLSEKAFFEKMKSLDAAWPDLSFLEIERDYLHMDAKVIVDQLENFLSLPFSEIFVTDAKGALVASTGKTSDYYQADEDWWQKSYSGGSGREYRSEIEFDKSSGVYAVALAVPIYVKGGVVGIFKGVLNKDELLEGLFRPFMGRANYMGIVRSDGSNVFAISSDAAKSQDYSLAVKEYIRRGAHDSMALIKMPDGRHIICGFIKIGRGLLASDYDSYAYFLDDYADAMAPLRGVIAALAFLWLGASVLFLFVIGFVFKKFLAPFGELRKGFSFLKKGLLDYRISAKSGDEFDALVDDFNAMMDDLRGNDVSKNFYKNIIQNMSDILFVINKGGAIDLVNRRACEMLEYEERELQGAPASQILAKKDRYIISWGLKGVVDELSLRDKKVSLLSKSGRELEVYLGTRSLRGADHNIVGLVCLAKDMTEVNKLIDALRRSSEEAQKSKLELEASLKELTVSRDVMLSVLEDVNESKAVLEQMVKRFARGSGLADPGDGR